MPLSGTYSLRPLPDVALKDAATQRAQVIGEHLQMIQEIVQKKNNVASK